MVVASDFGGGIIGILCFLIYILIRYYSRQRLYNDEEDPAVVEGRRRALSNSETNSFIEKQRKITGKRFMESGIIALKNNQYDEAINYFNKALDKGSFTTEETQKVMWLLNEANYLKNEGES